MVAPVIEDKTPRRPIDDALCHYLPGIAGRKREPALWRRMRCWRALFCLELRSWLESVPPRAPCFSRLSSRAYPLFPVFPPDTPRRGIACSVHPPFRPTEPHHPRQRTPPGLGPTRRLPHSRHHPPGHANRTRPGPARRPPRRNPSLCALLGIDGPEAIPHGWNLCRFLDVLGQEPHLSALRAVFDALARPLGLAVPDLGRNTAGDATPLSGRAKRSERAIAEETAQGLPQPSGGRKEYFNDEGQVTNSTDPGGNAFIRGVVQGSDVGGACERAFEDLLGSG
jgi:hypothetical protein